MIEIQLAIIAISAALNWVGGAFWHNARRFIMPVLIGLGASISAHLWWLGATCLPVIGLLVLGYGDKSPLRAFLGDAGARGMWMFLAALVLGLGSCLTHHLSLFVYIPYCIIAGILGATLRNIFELIGDLIFGAWLASFIIFIK